MRENYRVGVPRDGRWTEVLNSDAVEYGGSGMGNMGGVEATPVPYHGRFHSVVLTVPPLGAVLLRAPAPPSSAEELEREADTEPASPSASAERKTGGPGRRRPGSAPAPGHADLVEEAWSPPHGTSSRGGPGSEGGPDRKDRA